MITLAGPVLRASLGADTPTLELAQLVSRYITDKQQRAADMDDMITGDLVHDAALLSLVQSAGASYELLPLSCIVDSTSTLVGVAIVETSETRVRNEKQTQLLGTLGANLLQTGDSPGVRVIAND